MSTIESAVRDLAALAGRDNVSDEHVRQVARKLAEQYIDGVLDQWGTDGSNT